MLLPVAGLAGCGESARPPGPRAPQRSASSNPGRPMPGPQSNPPITYHDAVLQHIGKGSPHIKLWAITLLCSEVPTVTLAEVKAAVAHVLSEDVAAKFEDAIRSGPITKFDAPTDKFMLSIDVAVRPYWELHAIPFMDQKILDPEILKAFGEHRAFIAIQMIPRPDMPRDNLYNVLGKIAAQFLHKNVVCVHCRDADVYQKAGDEVAQVLRGEHEKPVLDFFQDRRSFATPRGDSTMQAAMDEARRRLPEFLEAWRTRNGNGMFLVKSRFETGPNREFMWIAVSDIAGEQVTGALGNQPLFAKHLREGQQVNVTLESVVDWAYCIGPGKSGGGFTDPMIRAAVGRA
jgi:uncharacterized protein YegJ (DUF2314 family)